MSSSSYKSVGSRPRREFSGLRQVNQLLSGTALGDLLERASQLQDLDKICQGCLPKSLQNYCQVINLADRNLVLATPSPVWAARLRLQNRSLLKCLHQNSGLRVDGIRIRVLPQEQPKPEKRHPAIRPSPASGSRLAQAARSIDDPELRSALLRLAAKAKTGK